MSVGRRIAWRYLTARKSHSAVAAISTVSLIGVAVATAAIVCVLSVFNGFRDVLGSKLDLLAPDILVAPVEGKTFANADSLAAVVKDLPEVAVATPTLTDNALALYGTREIPVLLKGVDPVGYDSVSQLRRILIAGDYFPAMDGQQTSGSRFFYDPDLGEYIELETSEPSTAALSVGTASRLSVTASEPNLMLFAPRRLGAISFANPAASFLRDSVTIASVWQSQQSDYDNDLVFTDISLARRLFQYDDNDASAIEIALTPGARSEDVAPKIASRLGDGFVVKNRLQQQETNFRMINIEKWVTFLLLAFILLIASFNIISTLSMLILEKQASLSTLRALGMSRRKIGGIFFRESLMVTFIGAGIGIVLGVVLCLLQQHFGFIKLSGDESHLVINSYPVRVQLSDIAAIILPVAVVGLIAAWVAAAFARTRASQMRPVAD